MDISTKAIAKFSPFVGHEVKTHDTHGFEIPELCGKVTYFNNYSASVYSRVDKALYTTRGFEPKIEKVVPVE